MAVKSHDRGHETICKDGIPYFIDTNTPVADAINRPCKHCGEPPTPDGYDVCIGHVPGAVSVCCGHGVVKPFVVWRNK